MRLFDNQWIPRKQLLPSQTCDITTITMSSRKTIHIHRRRTTGIASRLRYIYIYIYSIMYMIYTCIKQTHRFTKLWHFSPSYRASKGVPREIAAKILWVMIAHKVGYVARVWPPYEEPEVEPYSRNVDTIGVTIRVTRYTITINLNNKLIQWNCNK